MKPIWTILITVVATAAVVGGGTYYLINKSADKDKSHLQAQIDDLNAKVTSATKAPSKTVASGTTVNSGATVSTGTTVTSGAATTGTAVANPTASWKTYTNSTYNFSFKYPATFTAVAGARSLDESMGTSCQTITLDAHTGIIVCDVIANLTDYGLSAPNGMDPTSTSNFTIGTRAAKKYISGTSVSYVVMSPANNRMEINGLSTNVTILEQLLGTLIFN
ncbi:MAG: hypothetical protein WCI57_00735 [Candidatus Berkelbacteria bacterium]